MNSVPFFSDSVPFFQFPVTFIFSCSLFSSASTRSLSTWPTIIHLHHPCKFSHSGFVTSYDSQPQPSAMLWHSLLHSLQRKKRERHIVHVFYIASRCKQYILVSLSFSSTMTLEAPQLILWKPWSSHPVIFGCLYLWMIDNNLWSDFCRDSSVTIL